MKKLVSILLTLVLAVSLCLVTATPVAAAGGKICMVDPNYTGDQGAEIDGMYWYSTLAEVGSFGPGDDAIVYLAAGEHVGKSMPVGKVYDCLYLSGATNVQIIGAGADETIVWGQLSNIGTGTLVEGITFKGNLNEQDPPQDYRMDMGAMFSYKVDGAVTFDHVIFDGFNYHIAGMPDGSTVDHCDFIAEDFFDNSKVYRAITCDGYATVTNSIFSEPWYVLSGIEEGSPSEVRNNVFHGGNYGIPANNGNNITDNIYYDHDHAAVVSSDYHLPKGSPFATAGIDGTYIGAIAPPPPDEVWVDGNFTGATSGWGTTHFDKIQDGVAAVAETGTVDVAAGTYHETVLIDKGLTLQGAGDTTIIDAGGSTYGINIDAVVSGVSLQNLKVINAKEGIRWVSVSDSTISGVTVSGNSLKGIALYGPDSSGNTITDTIANDNGVNGISVQNSPNCTISNVTVSGNGKSGGKTGGINLKATEGCTITNANINNNNRGIYLNGATGCAVHRSNIVGNTPGIYGLDSIPFDATNNWWGDASGPSGAGFGTGDAVSNNVNYDPWANGLRAYSGTAQTGIVGTALANPFVAQLKNSSGNSTAIKDVPVSWNITSIPSGATGQSLSDTDTATDSSGQASSMLTLGNKAGIYTVTANVPGETTATFTATAIAGSLDHIVISPDTATITAGGTQAYAAEAFDQHDNSIGVVTGDTSFTIVEAGAGGSWAADVYTSENVGTWTVTGTYNDKSDTATLIVNPAALHTVTLTADPTNIPADGTSTSTITAIVKDQYGNPVVDGTEVTFTTDHGTLSSATATTTSGVATATLTSELSTETVIATVTATANGVSDAAVVFFIVEGGAEAEESEIETVIGSGTIEDTATGGDVTIDADPGTTHTITTAKYEDNPGGIPTFEATGDYYDVHLDNVTGVNSLTIDFCPAEPDTVIYYWDGTDWSPATDQSYSDGCVKVTVTSTTFPSLSDLTGLVFASGTPPPPLPPPPPVGGEAYPVNKLAILAPWIALAAAIIAGATIFMRRRRAEG